jgi:hypothetical protein
MDDAPIALVAPASGSVKSEEAKGKVHAVSTQSDEQEVIVRKPIPRRPPPARQKDAVIHYSDLD